DLRVADHAGGKRHLERQQIAAHSRVEHIARIGQHLDRRTGSAKSVRPQTPARTELHVQVHLDIEDGRKAGSSFAHVGEFWCLVDGECVGTSKLDEEQVVLNEVVTKCRFGKQTVCHPVGKGMLGIDAPLGGRRCLQTLAQAHALLPDLLARQLCPHLHSNSLQLSSSLCLWASPCSPL